jgi:ABC-type multidrug transport system permease subunit
MKDRAELAINILKMLPLTLVVVGFLYLGITHSPFWESAQQFIYTVIVSILIIACICLVCAFWDLWCEGWDYLSRRYQSWNYYSMLKRLEKEDEKRNLRKDRA